MNDDLTRIERLEALVLEKDRRIAELTDKLFAFLTIDRLSSQERAARAIADLRHSEENDSTPQIADAKPLIMESGLE